MDVVTHHTDKVLVTHLLNGDIVHKAGDDCSGPFRLTEVDLLDIQAVSIGVLVDCRPWLNTAPLQGSNEHIALTINDVTHSEVNHRRDRWASVLCGGLLLCGLGLLRLLLLLLCLALLLSALGRLLALLILRRDLICLRGNLVRLRSLRGGFVTFGSGGGWLALLLLGRIGLALL